MLTNDELANDGRVKALLSTFYTGPMGNVGPFETPEAATEAAVHALYSLLAEQAAAAAGISEELATLRAKLDQADGGDGLEPWRRAFDDAAGAADLSADGQQQLLLCGLAGPAACGWPIRPRPG